MAMPAWKDLHVSAMMPELTLGPKYGRSEMTETLSLAGTTVELVERGYGRPLLFLHAGEGLAPDLPWLELLSQKHRVIAPWHPGYGNSPLIDGSGSVDDLAYLYLDLAAELGLDNAVLVGACFGGWVAAEMMVRSTARFSRLVLVDPLGIKVRGRDERDIADMHALPRAEYLKLAWADPAKGDVDFTSLPEGELAAIVRGREAFTLYGWKPYMHNPRLRRWLHRIDRPTLLLWGAEDGIVTPTYGEAWRQAIPGAQLEVISQAGHFPHWEQPEAFVERLSAFVDTNR
jgi:pimeloyl-ACP methyl ester carboxylesterase